MKSVGSGDLRLKDKAGHPFTRTKALVSLLSVILFTQSFVAGLCLVFAWLANESISSFLVSLILFLAGGFGAALLNSFRFHFSKWGATELMWIWIVLIVSGMVPYILSKEIISLTDSFFESTSGYTATGTTIFSSLDFVPRSIILWRALTHWLGGLVTLLSVVLIIPRLNFGGNRFSDGFLKGKIWTSAELKSVVILVLVVYSSLTVLQTTLLYFGKLCLFDSLCLSFSTVSSGCFLPHGGSLEAYSAYIQYVVVLFMFLSGSSYFAYFLLLKHQRIASDMLSEICIYLSLILVIASFVIGYLYVGVYSTFESALRFGLFQVVSLSSSSGFSVSNYFLWPKPLLLLLFLIMALGSVSGSTS